MPKTRPSNPTYFHQPSGRARFNGHACPHCLGQHTLPIGLVLGVEKLRAGHGHQPDPQSFRIGRLYGLRGDALLLSP